MTDGRNRDRLFGWVLICVGGLIATLSGLCSAAMVGPGVVQLIQHPPPPGASSETGIGLLLVLLFGGIPFLLGAGMLIAGVAMVRNASKP